MFRRRGGYGNMNQMQVQEANMRAQRAQIEAEEANRRARERRSVPVTNIVVQQAPQPMQTLAVTIPGNVMPGQSFQIAAPNGQQFSVVCPPTSGPGQQLLVQVPAPQPVTVAATPVAVAQQPYSMPPPPPQYAAPPAQQPAMIPPAQQPAMVPQAQQPAMIPPAQQPSAPPIDLPPPTNPSLTTSTSSGKQLLQKALSVEDSSVELLLIAAHLVDEDSPINRDHGIISVPNRAVVKLRQGDLVNGLGGVYNDYIEVDYQGKVGKISRNVVQVYRPEQAPSAPPSTLM